MTGRPVRVFAAVAPAQLAALWADRLVAIDEVVPLIVPMHATVTSAVRPTSTSDELDELADEALRRAAARSGDGRALVLVADVDPDAVGSPGADGYAPLRERVPLHAVAAVFLGEDDRQDADLLWYASQEIPAVVELVTGEDVAAALTGPADRVVDSGEVPA